jgi:predicted nucleotidyltransferase
MSQALGVWARRLGCSERTLRRYVNEGLIRGRRLAGSGGVELTQAEEAYLDEHWELLSGLRRALRTERGVRLAVLFGSTAVGEDAPDSDVDLLVAHSKLTALGLAGLQMRLARALGRRADVVGLEQAEAMPTLLADALDEGRVLIDRDGLWVRLRARSEEVRVAAEREERALATGARAAVAAARERIAAAA